MSFLLATESIPTELEMDFSEEVDALYAEEKPDCSCCPPSDESETGEKWKDVGPLPEITVVEEDSPRGLKRKLQESVK